MQDKFSCSSYVWMNTASLSHTTMVTTDVRRVCVYRMWFVSIPSCCPVDKRASSKSDPEQRTVEASRGRARCVWSTREDERLRRSSGMFTPALHCRGLWWSTEREKNKQKEKRGTERGGERGNETSPVGSISWGLLWHVGFQYTVPFDVPVIKEKKKSKL